jgi:hypothetical protein
MKRVQTIYCYYNYNVFLLLQMDTSMLILPATLEFPGSDPRLVPIQDRFVDTQIHR